MKLWSDTGVIRMGFGLKLPFINSFVLISQMGILIFGCLLYIFSGLALFELKIDFYSPPAPRLHSFFLPFLVLGCEF